MTLALVVLGLAAYAVFLLWRIGVERGRVGTLASELEAWTRAIRDLERTLGEALLPAVRTAADAVAAFARFYREGAE